MSCLRTEEQAEGRARAGGTGAAAATIIRQTRRTRATKEGLMRRRTGKTR